MKTLFATFVCFIYGITAYAGNLQPPDPKTPLLELYECHFDSPPKDAPPHTHYAHVDKPVLTVYSLSKLFLQADKKGVRVVLTEEDTKKFAKLTHKNEFLLLQGGSSSGVTMHIRAPIEDGSLTFDDLHYSGAVAKYLRDRFQLKPNSNESKTAGIACDNEPPSEVNPSPAIWITGEVFTRNDLLFFRADKAVRDNPLGNVILLGATKQAANSLLPVYLHAADKHMQLRLYGTLLPTSKRPAGHQEPLPNVEFITWKVHMPSDPDELPADQKIIFKPDDSPHFKEDPDHPVANPKSFHEERSWNIQDHLQLVIGSASGGRTAAIVKRGGKSRVVLDGARGEDYIDIKLPMFSPDGKHLAYAAFKGLDWHVILDGHEQASYEEIKALVFSSNGKHLAYYAQKRQLWRSVLDGEEGTEFDEVVPNTPVFSDDGEAIAFAGRRRKAWKVVHGFSPETEYDWIAPGSLTFSRDGKHLAYVARRGDHYLAVADTHEQPEWDSILRGTPVFSPDGQHMAYLGCTAEKAKLILDGKELPEYADAWSIVFGPDGKHLAGAIKKDGRAWVVVDGKPGPKVDGIGSMGLIFSSDGKTVAYSGRCGRTWEVMGTGIETLETDGIGKGSLVFSPDSRHVVYGAGIKGKWHYVVDGKPGPGFDSLSDKLPVFTPDSRHVAYLGTFQNKDQVVIDGHLSPDYDAVVQETMAFHDGVLEFMAIKNGTDGTTLYRVTYQL